jgi:hypothetical protein
VSRLALLSDDEGHAQLRRDHGAGLAAAIRDALDAVEAVYATGTSAVRDWPEQARRVLARIAAVREALARGGVDGETRRLAHGLVQLIEPDRRAR